MFLNVDFCALFKGSVLWMPCLSSLTHHDRKIRYFLGNYIVYDIKSTFDDQRIKSLKLVVCTEFI